MQSSDQNPQPRADMLSLGYADRLVVDHLSLVIPEGQITTIIGANACGKSTLLRGLARLLKPRTGTVYLNGDDIARLPSKIVATRVGILAQSLVVPDGLTVAELVALGRYPYQR
jgi:ABC-type cobalamin/Fe3+-siderophores transport system ATPase subunit